MVTSPCPPLPEISPEELHALPLLLHRTDLDILKYLESPNLMTLALSVHWNYTPRVLTFEARGTCPFTPFSRVQITMMMIQTTNCAVTSSYYFWRNRSFKKTMIIKHLLIEQIMLRRRKPSYFSGYICLRLGSGASGASRIDITNMLR